MTSEQPGRSEERISSDAPELRALAQEITDDCTARIEQDTADAKEPETGSETGAATISAETSQRESGSDGSSDTVREGFSLLKTFGGWGALLDAGLPGVAFVVTYAAFGQNLRLSLLVAIALGGLFAVIRLWRKDPLQNVIGGFVAVAVAAAIANATGRAEDFYLVGLITNAVYLVGWGVANLFRYPLIGLVIGLAAGWGFEWRKDPKLMRAFLTVGWVWVAFFALRLVVQVPMYFNAELGKIAVARLLMGWPLWLLVVVSSYLVIKAMVPHESWTQVRQAAAQLAERGSPLARPENLGMVRTGGTSGTETATNDPATNDPVGDDPPGGSEATGR